MARFLCFNAQSHSHKTKRSSHMPIEATTKTSEDCHQNHLPTNILSPASLKSLHIKGHDDTFLKKNDMLLASSSIERCWKSEEIRCSFIVSGDTKLHTSHHLKKSSSLGNVVAQVGMDSSRNEIGDAFDQTYSCNDARDLNGIITLGDKITDPVKTVVLDQSQAACLSNSPKASSDMVNNHSIFSIGDTQIADKGAHAYTYSENDGSHSGQFSMSAPRVVLKSPSLPNISAASKIPYRSLGDHSKSSDDLRALEARERDDFILKVGSKENDKAGKNNLEIIAENGFESYNYFGTAKDWVVPAMDESDVANGFKGEISENAIDGSPSMDFKIKRIEEWVVNLQHCSSLEKNDELLHESKDGKRVSEVDDTAAIVKVGSKGTTGMEAAKRYISSLPAAANTVHLVNHGLGVIPFLSAFVSLKVLNLSGNAIGRITAGALPRGLHFLNLSRNCISTIEGLRDLGRLRILDLSYNRIFRIGHGLASCSSLKELYLAGNKISEVEGLHRLLKLNVLDLRFNKISTAKCVGQLAANYSSMQAISLEGNPAQKNVGDEQLKKQLQSLLPHLVYYNRRPLKETSARLGSFSQQFDRGGLRPARKGKASGSSRKAVVSSRGRPPSSSRAAGELRNPNFGVMESRATAAELSMRRSRSEGTLGAIS